MCRVVKFLDIQKDPAYSKISMDKGGNFVFILFEDSAHGYETGIILPIVSTKFVFMRFEKGP